MPTTPLGQPVLFTETRAPTATDDANTLGARAGYWWLRTDTGQWWVCQSAATGAAVWVETQRTDRSFKLATGQTVFKEHEGGAGPGRTVSHLVSFRGNTSTITGAIVFVPPFAATSGVMHSMRIRGYQWNTPQIHDIIMHGYFIAGAWSQSLRTILGTTATQTRWAINPSGVNCLIVGDVGTVWPFPHIVVTEALFSHTGATDAYCQNWTALLVTDLTGYTNIVTPAITSPAGLDAELLALAALDATPGVLAQTGAGAFSKRTLTAPAAGFTITNPAGTAGNPTFVLANDLAALEGLATTGGAAFRIGADTWALRTPTATNGIALTNGDGIAGAPAFALTGVSLDYHIRTTGPGSEPFDNPRVTELGSAAFMSAQALSGTFLSTLNSAYQILPGDHNKALLATSGAPTYTLPSAATVLPGWRIWVKARGTTVTVAASGAETVDGGASVSVGTGTSAMFVRSSATGFEALQ